jgi:hypothetical protein
MLASVADGTAASKQKAKVAEPIESINLKTV